MSVREPTHDRRIKGPHGLDAKKDDAEGLVVHTTEGRVLPNSPLDRYGVIDYLSGSRGISVPYVCDDDGETKMVDDFGMGSSHACGLPRFSGVEQCATAAWSRKTWLNKHREVVQNTARRAAWYVAEVMDLPVTEKILKKVVIGHNQDYRYGGCSTHTDPGGGYPWAVFRADAIEWAREKGYRVVATDEDRRRVRSFGPSRVKQAKAYARRLRKIGWRVIVKRRYHQADLDDGGPG